MKNEYMELKKFRWRKTQRDTNKEGVAIYHSYPEERDMTWWDDFGFFINGVYHVVWWVHPRMKYKDKVDSIAYDKVRELYPREATYSLLGGNKIWKKVGKSRKKVVAYESGLHDYNTLWYEAVLEAQDRVVTDNSIVITPSIQIEWLTYGKGIELCYPVELRNEQDITKFALEIKELIKSGKPLGLPYYTYTKESWIKEGHKNNAEIRSA